jgi:hypothetical protein
MKKLCRSKKERRHKMTDNRRKHFSQMNSTEISYLISAMKSRLQYLKFSPHALLRMSAKHVTANQILASLSYGKVIEAHNNIPGELRVLMRGKVAGNYVCSVVSLTTNEIVTVYWNQNGDNHKTLDKSAYAWNVDLTQKLSIL